MKKIGIFYGSSTGNTAEAAEAIFNKIGNDKADLFDVSSLKDADVYSYEMLIFGSSTWGAGDIQDDFENFLYDIKDNDFSGKKIALFGMGDQYSHGDTFANALGEIYQTLSSTNATFVGFTSIEGYDYDDTESVVDGKFVGLVLDEDNQSELTDSRIESWTKNLGEYLN
jgi:flavodoxin I